MKLNRSSNQVGESVLIAEQPISASECREALGHVLASSHFRRSSRLRHLLGYVVEKSLEDDGASLTEQKIGIALFERRPSYDTSADNIVRVNATELRKRLQLFYSDEGSAEPVHIEIPRGSYKPVFLRPRPDAHKAPDTNLPVPEFAVAEPDVLVHEASGSTPTPSLPVQAPRRTTQALFWLVLLLILSLVSSGIAIVQTVRVGAMEKLLEPWRSQPALRDFWKGLLGPHVRTSIVLADTSFAMAQDLVGYKLTLNDYLRQSYRTAPETPLLSSADGKGPNSILALLSSRNSGSISDFRTARRIVALSPASSSLQVQFARDFTGEALRHDSTILIGSSRSNPWVEPFQGKLFYRMQPSADNRGIEVRVVNPRDGEQAVYSTSSDPNRTDGFCVIALLPNLGGEGETLILAGTDSQATEAGGDFVVQESTLRQLRDRLGVTSFEPFQLLLRTSRVPGSPLSTSMVSVRRGSL